MKAIAVIPARGGSKGVPRKNLRTVQGMTLVHRSIQHAMNAPCITRIVVTSDDEEILEHAKNCGAEIVRRPDELATDDASGDAVIVHALEASGITPETVEEEHATVFLQPTAPIRPFGVIDECVSRLYLEIPGTNGRSREFRWLYDAAFTAYEGHFAWRMFARPYNPDRPDENTRPRALPVAHQKSRLPRQKIPIEHRVFIENGVVYATRTSSLLKTHNRIAGDVGIVLMDREDSIDVDTEYDLWLAEQRLRYLGQKNQKVAV